MRSCAPPLVAVLALALGGASASAGYRPGASLAEPPVLSTNYVAQLRAVAAQVDTSLREVTALPARAAADRATYGQRAGVTLPAPTARQRSTARQLFDAAVATVAERQIVRWTGDEGLAEVLTAGSLATVDSRLREELGKRLRLRAEREITEATGLSIALLLLSPTSSLPDARNLAARIERELSRSGFLKLDLRRAGKLDVLAQLERAESLTRTALALFRARFLLDSPMARADLNALVDRAKCVLHDVEEISRRLAATPGE